MYYNLGIVCVAWFANEASQLGQRDVINNAIKSWNKSTSTFYTIISFNFKGLKTCFKCKSLC